jgi:anaerobic ribonucleoside-triphosphate reductase activating protein
MNDAEKMDLIRASDVLVDGPFLLAQRRLDIRFRGSANQRIIDVPKTLQRGEVVEWRSDFIG